MERAKTDEKLQMLFDGELSPEEEAELRRELDESPEGQEELRQWSEMRAAMQEASTDWSAELDSDALFARIEAEIEPTTMADPSTAVSVDPPRATKLRVLPGGREKRIWGGVVTGFAAAAAIVLAVVSSQDPHGAPLDATRGTEVVEVDFGANSGTVFNVEGGAGQPLAVVWIDEEAGRP